MIRRIVRHARRLVVFVIGSTVLLFGVLLIFTPGPAIIVIPIGLAILATEFVWARILLEHAKKRVKHAHKAIFRRKNSSKN